MRQSWTCFDCMATFHPASTFGADWCRICKEYALHRPPGSHETLFRFPKRTWERQVIVDLQEEEDPGDAPHPSGASRRPPGQRPIDR